MKGWRAMKIRWDKGEVRRPSQLYGSWWFLLISDIAVKLCIVYPRRDRAAAAVEAVLWSRQSRTQRNSHCLKSCEQGWDMSKFASTSRTWGGNMSELSSILLKPVLVFDPSTNGLSTLTVLCFEKGLKMSMQVLYTYKHVFTCLTQKEQTSALNFKEKNLKRESTLSVTLRKTV